MTGNTSRFSPWEILFKLGFLTLLIFQIAPIFIIIQTSLKTSRSLLEFGVFSGGGWTLVNYYKIFMEQTLGSDLFHSWVIATATMFLAVSSGALMAFALTRSHSRLKKNLVATLLISRLLPPVALVLPLFMVFRTLNLHDSLLGLILAHTALNFPMVTWMLMPFMDAVPKALEEAAALEGSTIKEIFFHVTLPLVRSGLVISALFSFLMSWNDFLFALVLAGSKVKTAPLTLNGYITGFGTEWGPLCAGACVLLLPVFALSFKLHKHMTHTPQAGAVKGV